MRDVAAGPYPGSVPHCGCSLKEFREAEGGKCTSTDVPTAFSNQLHAKTGPWEKIFSYLKVSVTK